MMVSQSHGGQVDALRQERHDEGPLGIRHRVSGVLLSAPGAAAIQAAVPAGAIPVPVVALAMLGTGFTPVRVRRRAFDIGRDRPGVARGAGSWMAGAPKAAAEGAPMLPHQALRFRARR